MYVDHVDGEWGAFNEIMKRKDLAVQGQVGSLQMKIVAEDKVVEQKTQALLQEWEREKPIQVGYEEGGREGRKGRGCCGWRGLLQELKREKGGRGGGRGEMGGSVEGGGVCCRSGRGRSQYRWVRGERWREGRGLLQEREKPIQGGWEEGGRKGRVCCGWRGLLQREGGRAGYGLCCMKKRVLGKPLHVCEGWGGGGGGSGGWAKWREECRGSVGRAGSKGKCRRGGGGGGDFRDKDKGKHIHGPWAVVGAEGTVLEVADIFVL